MADLGSRLCDSGLGIPIGDVIIPGVFFADDMVIGALSDADFQALLDITGQFGRERDLKFSSEKSKVLSHGEGIDTDRTWVLQGQILVGEQLGQMECEEVEEEEVVISEAKEYSYLGVGLTLYGSLFGYAAKKLVQKAKKARGMIIGIAKSSLCFAGVAQELWVKVGLMTILYGAEVFSLNSEQIAKLENVQRQMARDITRAPKGTAIQAMYGELGWKDMKHHLAEAKIRYFGRLQLLNEQAWCKQVFQASMELGNEGYHTSWWKDIQWYCSSYNFE